MKLARQDSNDRFDRLGRSLDGFCQQVAENNSKALMEALKDVIREFNDKITEQFGENFKQLNQAVGRTLEWQEKYREQISEMIEQQNSASRDMTIATQQYAELVSKSETFSRTAQSLSSLLTSLEIQKTQLEQSLLALTKLLDSAAKGLPAVEEKIIEMVRQVGDGVKNSHTEFHDLLLKASQTSSLTVQQVGNSVKAANEEFKTVLLNTIHTSNQEFNTNIRQIIDKTKEQVVILDNALSDELSKSLKSLAQQLAALSEKFVADYSPLTDKLAKVLEIAG